MYTPAGCGVRVDPFGTTDGVGEHGMECGNLISTVLKTPDYDDLGLSQLLKYPFWDPYHLNRRYWPF